MKDAALAGVLALASLCVNAAPVYRCGPDGRTYSQTPCPGGRIVESTDPRSAAQRAEARRVQAAERETAKSLERERLAFEKKGKSTPAIASLGPAEVASEPARESKRSRKAKGKGSRRSKEGKDFTAVVPGDKAAAKP